MEFPACIASIFIIDKLGCRPTLSGGLILCGVTCLITGLVPEGNKRCLYFTRRQLMNSLSTDFATIRVFFSMIGKLLISSVMATVSLYTSDLFPTPVRSAALGLCSTSGRVGGILAPIIANAVSLTISVIPCYSRLKIKFFVFIGTENRSSVAFYHFCGC